MIDIGTIPLADSISRLTFFMDDEKYNKNVGGVAGEIEVFMTEAEGENDGKPNCWDKFENYSLFLA
jgi:chitin synthase